VVRVVDRGWSEYMKRMNSCRDVSSRVGYPTSDEKYGSGPTVVEVAAVHEFGAPKANVPMRAHVRTTYDEDVENLARRARIELGKVADGTSTAAESISRLGLYHANKIRQKIKQGPFTPLKPSTIRRKGSSRPLIDTAQMLQSVTHVEKFE
jgi:hypothetical protein